MAAITAGNQWIIVPTIKAKTKMPIMSKTMTATNNSASIPNSSKTRHLLSGHATNVGYYD